MNRGELYWQRPVPAHPSGLSRPEASRGPGQPCAKRRPRCAGSSPLALARPGRVRRRPPSRPAPAAARPCPLARFRG